MGIAFSQVTAVGQLALTISANIATLGGAGAVTAAANTAKNVGKLAKLKSNLNALKAAVKGNSKIAQIAAAAKKVKAAKQKG